MENGIRFDLEYETMPWHRVDAVVFDIGNILIRYAPKDFLEQLFPGDAQKQQDMLARVYKGPYRKHVCLSAVWCDAGCCNRSKSIGMRYSGWSICLK